MKILVLFSCIFSSTTATQSPLAMLQPDGRIIGGEDTDIRDHPYQVSLTYGGSHTCGGSILSSKYVLTAAHCLGRDIQYYKVRVGSSEVSQGTEYDLEKFILHEMYGTSNTFDYDIALIQMVGSIIFGPTVQPVKLPQQGESVPVGSRAVITGWGTTETSYPPILQKVEVPIISNAQCASAYKYDYIGGIVTQRMICAGFPEGGKDACMGDSGGPMVVEGKEVGIVSWGARCAHPDEPGAYTRVALLRNWILMNSGV